MSEGAALTTRAAADGPVVIDGKAVAAKIRQGVDVQARDYATRFGRRPGLAVVQVGEDPASSIYVRNKRKSCQETSIESFAYDVVGLVEALERGENPDAAAFALPCTLVFVKTAGRRAVETLRVTPDVRALLELCDGTANGSAIAARLSASARERGLDGGDMLSSVFRAAESLRRKNVLTYRAGASPAN